MTDTPKDPAKAGTRPGMGPQPTKRPAATIELQATEIERRDIPKSDAPGASAKDSAAAAEPAAAAKSTSGAATAESRKPDDAKATGKPAAAASTSAPAAAAAIAAKTPRRSSGVGGFLTHLVAGGVGAALAIFGADYLANTLGLNIPTYSAGQIEQLTRRMGVIEQDTKEHGAGVEINGLKEQLESLKAKLEQTAVAAPVIDTLRTQQKQLIDRAGKLEQMLSTQAANPELSNRLGKIEDQFKMLAQSGASGQGGQPGQMAALVTRFDTIGSTLDAHLAETRKSLQGDLQKQSAHFEDRLSEIDKGLSVETLKASNKTLGDQIVGMKAEAQKLSQDIASVGAGNQQLRQDLAALQASTGELKMELQAATGSFAKSDQLTSVNATTSKLQADLAAITARDQSREQGSNRILLSLQLANLKRVVERGGGYAKELAEVKRIAPKDLDLTSLEANADKGLPTATQLSAEFKDLTWSLINAGSKSPDDASLIGQLWQGARSVVQVRKTGEVSGEGADAIVARTEARLQTGDLDGTLREAGKLQGDARKAAEPWLGKLAARLSLDQSIAAVDAGLVKLMGPSGTN